MADKTLLEDHKVFVYGSLKRGFHNHAHYLSEAEYLGTDITEPAFTMYDYGSFPAIIPRGNTAIHGEVYKVDFKTLRRLDGLERHPNWYNRRLYNTKYGYAYLYEIPLVRVAEEKSAPPKSRVFIPEREVKSGIWQYPNKQN